MITICVDFDGTIVDHAFPEIGEEVPHALRVLTWLKDLPFIELILLTMRSTDMGGADYLTEAVDYLEKKGVTFDFVNENPNQSTWTTSNKVYGNYYIDNVAVGCPLITYHRFNRDCVDWLEVEKILKKEFIRRGFTEF